MLNKVPNDAVCDTSKVDSSHLQATQLKIIFLTVILKQEFVLLD
jgi:hypothetical protein